MHSRRTPRPSFVLATLAGLALASACKSSEPQASEASKSSAPDSAEISNEFTAMAEVVGVERETRVLTVRREDGTQLQIEVGPAVRNFEQIAAGDALVLRYRETLAVEVVPPGTAAEPPQVGVTAARAEPGERPAAGLGTSIRLRVKVESIDMENHVVVFSLASGSGELLARRVGTPEGREFVSGLEVGDDVRVEYIELVAVEVSKP